MTVYVKLGSNICIASIFYICVLCAVAHDVYSRINWYVQIVPDSQYYNVSVLWVLKCWDLKQYENLHITLPKRHLYLRPDIQWLHTVFQESVL